MSDLVGNSPRGDIPGNSHKSRESKVEVEPREPAKKVVTGKVVINKPPWWKRMVHSMLAEDVSNVGDFVVTDVFAPAVRNLIYDIISKGSYRVLYGVSGARRLDICPY